MKYLSKKIVQNKSSKVLIRLFLTLILLISYFITHSYFVQIGIYKAETLDKLEVISKMAASNLEGNQLEYLQRSYTNKSAIKTNNQDQVYQLLHNYLSEIKLLNNLKTPIYTIFKEDNRFYFGVNSEEQPYYRHEFTKVPIELSKNYEDGGLIDVYEDENGHWLSAFSPIKNSKGRVIAVVQVDNDFDKFLVEARKEVFFNICLSLLITLIIAFFLLRAIRLIFIKEDKLNADLIHSKLELEAKSKETEDSIKYAKRIQETILPTRNEILESFPESFILHLPKDIVSGDFYWHKRIGNKIFIACADCTGHGVPGALMSMIGKVLLDEIVDEKKVYEPDLILTQLHNSIVKALSQNLKEESPQDGMDLAICVFDEELKTLKFAGAFRPLIHIRDGVINRIKADAASVGGIRVNLKKFTMHQLNIKKGDSLYLYSDGYADQFGGERNKKYMTKRFRTFLLTIAHFPIKKQFELLQQELKQWQGEEEQVDDILVIGIKV